MPTFSLDKPLPQRLTTDDLAPPEPDDWWTTPILHELVKMSPRNADGSGNLTNRENVCLGIRCAHLPAIPCFRLDRYQTDQERTL
jgi:hypothetical protein